MPMTDDNPPSDASTPRRAVPPARLRTVILIAAGLTLLSPAAVAVLAPGFGHPVGTPRLRPAAPTLPAPTQLRIDSADRLERLFDRIGYDLDAVADGLLPVPPIELAALPGDLGELSSVERRKALFIRAVLPIVIGANQAVLRERAALDGLLARLEAGRPLSREQRHRFVRTAGRYGLPELSADRAGIQRLLRRVDAVPVSLAVAQAISESGWGTSRFARTGNALFGQWTWDAAAGIVPAARPGGATHRVRSFASLADSARAYLHNLNTHPAYAGFRKARAAARGESGVLPEGAALARHLTRYSERGAAYVEDVLALIRLNRLARLDTARLGAATRYARLLPPAHPLLAGTVEG